MKPASTLAFSAFFLLFTFLFSCGGSGDSQNIAPVGSCSKKVLFIGNSYTYSNNMPGLIYNLAAADDCTLSYDSHTPGGTRFLDHAASPTAMSKIASDLWDAVILQNQSQVPGWKPADVTSFSLPHAKNLVDAIKANHSATRAIYFQTWGRQYGDAGNCGYYPKVCDFDGHADALIEGYNIYKNYTTSEVAQVGLVWKTIVNAGDSPFSSASLWSGDGSHPAMHGSYLAANVIYKKIFSRSPLGNSYRSTLSSTDAEYIQQYADAVD